MNTPTDYPRPADTDALDAVVLPSIPESDMHRGRRRDLVTAALQTWSEHGYSQVSVRNVARRTRFSHGMVHYYFSSKDALVAECVQLLSQNSSLTPCRFGPDTSVADVSAIVADAVREVFLRDRQLHRIRFDLRNQSQFDSHLRPYSDHLDRSIRRHMESVREAYAAAGCEFDPSFDIVAERLDALVERAVLADSFGDEEAANHLHDALLQILPTR